MEHFEPVSFREAYAKLLEACEFSFSVLGHMDTDQFAQGGDRCVRDRLANVLLFVQGGCRQMTMEECHRAINEAIRLNAAGSEN